MVRVTFYTEQRVYFCVNDKDKAEKQIKDYLSGNGADYEFLVETKSEQISEIISQDDFDRADNLYCGGLTKEGNI